MQEGRKRAQPPGGAVEIWGYMITKKPTGFDISVKLKDGGLARFLRIRHLRLWTLPSLQLVVIAGFVCDRLGRDRLKFSIHDTAKLKRLGGKNMTYCFVRINEDFNLSSKHDWKTFHFRIAS